jgi:PBP1b-binding outer membrane lipoprotein LpoB
LKKIIFIALIILLNSCGNKKAPTGGPKDSVNPTIVSIFPDEFSEIKDVEFIEITFSKAIERSSILTGIYFYPPINKKKFKWNKNVLKILIEEDLEDDTNYFLTLNTKIKGEHSNKLDQEYLFIFRSGELQDNKISGKILFEDADDKGKEIFLKLLAADSTFIYSQKFKNTTYQIENLNNEEHIITAFIDKNENNRYDFEQEAYYKKIIPPKKVTTLNIEMVYADSTKPKVKKIKVTSSTQLDITFSEPIKSFSGEMIFVDSTETVLPIKLFTLQEDKLMILTSEMDTLKYQFNFAEFSDLKDNFTEQSTTVFVGKTVKDSIPPEILHTFPKNGQTINTLNPEIVIEFSELLFSQDIIISLFANESNKSIDLNLKSTNNKRFVYTLEEKLENFTSYTFVLTAFDPSNNFLLEFEDIVFIPILR